MKYLEERILDRQEIRGEWNYAVLPAPAPGRTRNRTRRPGPDARPAHRPGRPRRHHRPGCPAAGRRGALGRRPRAAAAPGPRRRPPQGQRRHPLEGCPSRPSSPPPPATSGSACPTGCSAELLGAHETTISLAARRVIPLLAEHGITRQHGGTRIATLGQLRTYAATAGITLPAGTP